ncbi:hypothetical protein [Microbulbifer sp.]|uniref:YobI family P-loop NTPase n=1 Tax=Microbulbifer sp. TaxID=1908541 RepID=UPI00339000A4
MNEPTDTNSRNFPDLTPTNDAGSIDEYEDRLKELLVNRNDTVHEIAITSPYSGGKSSFIATYMRKHPYHRYTCISLAAFKGVNTKSGNLGVGASEKKQEATGSHVELHGDETELNKIEKSIVQQILYRTKSENAPNSRFRRIFPFPLPESKAYRLSAPIAIWLIALILLYFVPNFNVDGIFTSVLSESSFANYNLWLFAFLAAVPILLVKDGVKEFHRFSISKINLSKGEVALTQRNNDSIFNIYLEELIYYFATTGSDVVFFEDLDRFEESEIFIKLKELNKLINDSADVKKSVRFIYALKDDVFKGNDRTKFFDSIIPIIPIASTSNSFPHLRNLIVESKIQDDLDDKFLRDMSVYLDDMRMLKNIVSEYGIYKNTLTKGFENLNRRQLFSFIIYKNVYCDDFAQLHYGKGKLASAFSNIQGLKNSRRAKLEKELKDLEERLINSENELTESILDLNSKYLLKIMKEVSPTNGVIEINSQNIYNIPNPDIFDRLIESQEAITLRHQPNQGYRQVGNKRFGSWLDDMNPSYSIRKSRIQDKIEENRREIIDKIRKIREKIETINASSLRDLSTTLEGKELFGEDIDMPLLAHMIERGYIDEHYHLYISHFIEGNMTRNDMDYVMSVKNKNPLERNRKINRIPETLEYLSDDEYKTVAFLNYDILNYLLNNDKELPLKSLINYAIKDDQKCFDILKDTFENVKLGEKWIDVLSKEWPEICVDIVSNSNCSKEQKNILLMFIFSESGNNSRDVFLRNPNEINAYISRSESIADNFPTEERKRKKIIDYFSSIGVKFQDLSGCAQDTAFVRYSVNYQLFDINENNLEIALSSTGNKSISASLDYSKIARVDDSGIINLIEDNLGKVSELIASNVVKVSQNEDFYYLLSHSEIPTKTKVEMIDNLDFSLWEAARVGDGELISDLFDSGHVAPNWKNISTGIESIHVDGKSLISLLAKAESVKSLCEDELDLTDDNCEILSRLILSAEIDEASFDAYLRKLNYKYSVNEVLHADRARILHLIDVGNFDIDSSAYDELREIDNHLSNHMLAENFDVFSADGKLIHLTISPKSFYSLLGMGNLSKPQKRVLIGDRLDLIQPDFDNNDLITALFDSNFLNGYSVDRKIPEIPAEILISLLDTIPKPEKRKELAIGQIQYLNHTDIENVLKKLGRELEKIPDSKSYVFIEYSDINRAFAQAITKRKYVSSFSEKEDGLLSEKKIRINRKRATVGAGP